MNVLKRIRELGALLLMGLPIWIATAGFFQEKRGTLVVHLDEPGVQVWVGDRLHESSTRVVGPIELATGDYRMRVERGGDTLYAEQVVLEEGERKEIWAQWLGMERGEGVSSLGESKPITEPASTPFAVGFGNDQGQGLSAGEDGVLRFWNLKEGRTERKVAAHSGTIQSLATFDQGKRVVSAAMDGALRVWDTSSAGETSEVRIGEGSGVRCVATTEDGRLAAVACESGNVRVFDLKRKTMLALGSVKLGLVGGLAFTPDGNLLVVGVTGRPKTASSVEVWETKTCEVQFKMLGHEGMIWAVAVLPDGWRGLSVGNDQTLRVWDLTEGRELRQFRNHPGAARCLAVSNDGRYALVGTGHRWKDGWRAAKAYGVQVWDLVEGRTVGRFETETAIHAVALSPDGRRALAACQDKSLQAWEMPSETRLNVVSEATASRPAAPKAQDPMKPELDGAAVRGATSGASD